MQSFALFLDYCQEAIWTVDETEPCMVHQPTAALDRCGKRAPVLVAIGLREASVPEGMVAMHGISLAGGGWRCMWPGCILGSSLTYRALTLCPYLSINMSVGHGWGWGQGSLWQRRWPWKR